MTALARVVLNDGTADVLVAKVHEDDARSFVRECCATGERRTWLFEVVGGRKAKGPVTAHWIVRGVV